MGKTWRRSRTYYTSDGRRVGDIVFHTYRRYTGAVITSVYPKWVTDTDCWSMHYVGGEFKYHGWREPVHVSQWDHRLSAKARRTYEKRQFRLLLKEVLEEF